MENESFRAAFRDFIGQSQFNKLVDQFCRNRRLLFWQEVALEKFLSSHTQFNLDDADQTTLSSLLLYCFVHQSPLEFGPMTFLDGQVKYRIDESDRIERQELFPFSPIGEIPPDSKIVLEEEDAEPYEFPTHTTELWYCPVCREAKRRYFNIKHRNADEK